MYKTIVDPVDSFQEVIYVRCIILWNLARLENLAMLENS